MDREKRGRARRRPREGAGKETSTLPGPNVVKKLTRYKGCGH